MARKSRKKYQTYADSEIGVIRKSLEGRTTVILVYPNTYYVGMSNLGFQTVYHLLNQMEHVVCERAFLPDSTGTEYKRILSIESGRSVTSFDIIAFSVSFENDYLNLLSFLEQTGLPLQSKARGDPHPLVIVGGIACLMNPEPVAPYMDCIFIGEAEKLLPRFFDIYDSGVGRKTNLIELATQIPGMYIPEFYAPVYNQDEMLKTFEPLRDVPEKIKRVYSEDISNIPTCSAVLTPHTALGHTYLIEVSRGCPHGCRFCSVGYVYRPPRFRPLSLLNDCMDEGISLSKKIGLVGAAVSDLPDIKALCDRGNQEGIKISFSSFRADAMSPEFIAVLRESRINTATIAPDAGSERMRKVINKGITEEQILYAADALVESGIPNLKLYFMVGLPTETMEDIEAIVKLCKKVKQQFLISSRRRKRLGNIHVSVTSFVPKPFTPFQWAAMDDIYTLRDKIKAIKKGLKRETNVNVTADNPRKSYIQALLSRGDRRVAKLLSMAVKNSGNWTKTLKASAIDADFYATRERYVNELLPWDFIDHGISKSFLAKEYKRALEGMTSMPCPMESCTICGVCKDSKN